MCIRDSLKTIAAKGEGVDEVVESILKHQSWLEGSGELARKRVRRARLEIEAIAVTSLRERWRLGDDDALDQLAAQVVAGDNDPYRAADALLESLSD